MTSLTSLDEPSNEKCEYTMNCERTAMNYCQGCQHTFCMNHYLEHQLTVQGHFEHARQTQNLLNQNLKALISELSTGDIIYYLKQLYEFKTKSDEIETKANSIKQQLFDLSDENSRSTSMASIDESDPNQVSIENDIEDLSKDLEQQSSKFDELFNLIHGNNMKEERTLINSSVQSDDQSEMKTSLAPSSSISQKKKKAFKSVVENIRNNILPQSSTEENSIINRLLIQQVSPAILEHNKNENNNDDDDTYDDEENDAIATTSFSVTSRNNRKVRLSNNIVNWMRGPFRVMLDSTMHAVEVCAQGTHIDPAIIEVINEKLSQQKQNPTEKRNGDNPLLSPISEIASDWTYEGKNPDRGFTSASIWMRNPQGQRILVKTQDHPLCAANEWLAYALGRFLGLSVNEVQITVYKNDLVTLHTDVKNENEKILTFMDLPKHKRKLLLTDPAMECMDLFDHIIQNVDRNARNILITFPKTASINDDTVIFKIHLIDHSSCFGMGKLNGISVVACKFHSQHLSIVKFDPKTQARKFETYLNRLPISQRTIIKKPLNRFGAITDEQFDIWLGEVRNLLSTGQYDRIRRVLLRQRDIAKRYVVQWGISPRDSRERSESLSETISAVTAF